MGFVRGRFLVFARVFASEYMYQIGHYFGNITPVVDPFFGVFLVCVSVVFS